MAIKAQGMVLPPGTQNPNPVHLPEGTHTVTVEDICDDGLIRCVYPGGFVKHHQADSVEDLLAKVTAQLRGRYSVSDVQFTTVPKAIEAGESITVEV